MDFSTQRKLIPFLIRIFKNDDFHEDDDDNGYLHRYQVYLASPLTCPLQYARYHHRFNLCISTPFLRYNSRAIQLTQLKCVIQCFLVYLHICATTTVIHFRIFSWRCKETSTPEQSALIAQHPPPWLLVASCLLSVSVDLPVLHISYEWSPPYVAFSGSLILLLTRFIYVVAFLE